MSCDLSVSEQPGGQDKKWEQELQAALAFQCDLALPTQQWKTHFSALHGALIPLGGRGGQLGFCIPHFSMGDFFSLNTLKNILKPFCNCVIMCFLLQTVFSSDSPVTCKGLTGVAEVAVGWLLCVMVVCAWRGGLLLGCRA